MKKIHVTNETINQAKVMTQQIAESVNYDETTFFEEVEKWFRFNKNSKSYGFRLAVLTCAIVTGHQFGGCVCYNWGFYYAPTTAAVRALLPKVAKALKNREPLYGVMVDELHGEMCIHRLFSEENYYYSLPENEEGRYDWEENLYGIDMHMDSDYKEAV